MMKTAKMSLANIQGRLSRTEMKTLLGGKAIENSCGHSGQVYVWCKSNATIPDGHGGHTTLQQCWSGCIDGSVPSGCSTSSNNFCINQS